jgi:magnesium chelatase accessory protein
MMADWDLPALGRDLPRLAIPLLLIHGEADAAIALASARTAGATVANGRLVPLPGLGHLAHEEQPQTVATLITEFVAEVV